MNLMTGRPVEAGKSDKRFYSIEEAAIVLRLSYSTVYRAIRAGEFPAIKVRGRYVVPAKAIDELEASALNAGRETTSPPVAGLGA